VVLSNPKLTELISSRIGRAWIRDMEGELKNLERFADDAEFRKAWRQVKYENKVKLASMIEQCTGVVVDPSTLFDIQVKRIHEYKRQHLNILHVLTLYNRIKRNPNHDMVPRTVIFGGKAAPGYFLAKLIIKLINSVAELVNNDPDVAGRLKVVFFPNFNVKHAHSIYPAAELSEQISTAGKEASGTGNMKFSMNGALTIGTLDGANVEIREAVGEENFFLFGLSVDEVQQLKAGRYRPMEYVESNPELREVIDLLSRGFLTNGTSSIFKPLVDSLLYHDEYMLMADYESYLRCQERVDALYRSQEQWTKMSILNVARIGRFSSDRSIHEYAKNIWHVKPVKIPVGISSS
jgi:starch phosphorylase